MGRILAVNGIDIVVVDAFAVTVNAAVSHNAAVCGCCYQTHYKYHCVFVIHFGLRLYFAECRYLVRALRNFIMTQKYVHVKCVRVVFVCALFFAFISFSVSGKYVQIILCVFFLFVSGRAMGIGQ